MRIFAQKYGYRGESKTYTAGLMDVEGLGRCIVMEYVDGLTMKEWLEGTTTRQLGSTSFMS
jgi:hypothetical protein